jgi:AraC family transcriptional regulator
MSKSGMLPSFLLMQITGRGSSKILLRLVISLEPEFLLRTAPELVNPDQIELLPTFAQADPLIYGIGATLKNVLAKGTCERVYAESLLNTLSIHLLKNYCAFEPKLKQYQGGLPKYKLQQTIDYIQANLDRKLSLEAIAQNLDMSVYHFCDLFKQSVGISPYKYVLQQRVERAKQLLKDKESAIVDIAIECGFANQTHLNKHFRSFTGVTPKTYRSRG